MKNSHKNPGSGPIEDSLPESCAQSISAPPGLVMWCEHLPFQLMSSQTYTPATSSGAGDTEADGATGKGVDNVAVTVTMVVVMTMSDALGTGVGAGAGAAEELSASPPAPNKSPRPPRGPPPPRTSPRGRPCRFAAGCADSGTYSEGMKG